jgi:predicted O-linked N-acetylglucosamine transferase (SPINDLY family)
MSGRDVEIPENPERNYSERLVLLPDCGVIHNRPLYEPRGRAKSVPEFVINCSTCAQKVNYRFCRLLQRVISASQKPLRFRFFIGTTLHGYFNYAPFVRELGSLLQGARIEVIADRPYPDYMALMEEGDISIDAFHFGGCNTIADSLFLRIPTVTYEGDKWYNRIGSQMLRMAGIPDLVATNDDEYVRIAGRLIHDDSFRSRARQRLYGANLDATIFNANTARHFREAVDFLIENHERLARDPDRRALRIGVVG